ncbi:MAG: hypothetical protein KDD94_12030, partial [Calditrichaeota bacterium]|nr:hypothetical protein [Calditrichota bacterium]
MIARSLLIIGLFSILFGQTKQSIRFRQISIEDGLSQTSILDMMQDRQGFMWFATQDGLNKYDGYSFTYFKYDPYQHNTMSSNWVTTLFEDSQDNIWTISDGINLNRYLPVSDKIQRFRFSSWDHINRVISHRLVSEDRDGNLWVVNAAGFFRFDRQSEQFKSVPVDTTLFPPQKLIYAMSIFFDSKNRLWLATEDDHTLLLNYTNDGIRQIQLSAEIASRIQQTASREIKEDYWNNIWLLNDRELLRFDPGLSQYHRFPLKLSIPNQQLSFSQEANPMERFIEDKFHDLWFLTGSSLGRYDPESEQLREYAFCDLIANEKTLELNGLFEDSNGQLWLSSEQNGLLLYQRETDSFNAFTHNPAQRSSISDNAISSMFEDNNGTIWVGTNSAGVNYFNPNKQKFENYQFSDGKEINNDFVWGIAQDKNDIVWIATNGFGLVKYSTKERRVIRHYTAEKDGVGSSRIKTIFIDREGIIWLGTLGEGLISFNPENGKIRRFINKEGNLNSLANNFVNAIIEDHNGYLWIATSFGLNRFDKKNSFITYRGRFNDMNSLANTQTRSLYQDENGHIWVGTMYGLYELNPLTDKFTRYLSVLEDSTTISQNMVISLNGDRNGHIFIGTFGGGLNILDIKTQQIKLI